MLHRSVFIYSNKNRLRCSREVRFLQVNMRWKKGSCSKMGKVLTKSTRLTDLHPFAPLRMLGFSISSTGRAERQRPPVRLDGVPVLRGRRQAGGSRKPGFLFPPGFTTNFSVRARVMFQARTEREVPLPRCSSLFRSYAQLLHVQKWAYDPDGGHRQGDILALCSPPSLAPRAPPNFGCFFLVGSMYQLASEQNAKKASVEVLSTFE